TGQLVRADQLAHSHISVVRFSADGESFVCAASYGLPELRVWNARNGQPVSPPLVHYENLYDAEFSPDGKAVVAADSSEEVYVWDVASGRKIGAPIWTGGHTTLATFHPSGKRVLTVNNAQIRVWDLASELKRHDVPLDDPEDVRVAPYYEKYRLTNPH